jgi:RimJ/RimL family protein N-acetyltransferase
MQPSDAPALFAIYGDPDVMQYASDEPFPNMETVSVMLASVAHLLATGESLEWAVIEKVTRALVGTCGLHSFDEGVSAAEVGCMLARAAWGRGIMREALPALFNYAQEVLAVRVLRADIDAPNQRSLRLFRQLGFHHAHDTIYERTLLPGIVRSLNDGVHRPSDDMAL